jgi:hypothetical protein
MTVSSTTTKVSYAGNGATTVFAYTFKIFAAADLEVVLRSAAGVETVQTITTHYTVSGAGADAGGNVTFVTAPASGVTVIIRRALALTQGTDYVENDPFPANSHEDALDRLTFITQQMQEELDRSIKASVTNTISTVEFSTSAADRANKLFSFDSSGDLQISQELGTYRGNWSASTLYYQRDIIKDTSNNNIYLANTQHTSTGAQPISSNADVAKWDLIVDAAAAATSATNAANSATAAATSETNAATSASNAATSETNAGTSETNAASSASGAATSATNASNSASAASTSASNASTSATNAASSASAASTSATNAASSASAASTSATNASNSASAASTSASNAATSETNAAASAASAEAAAASVYWNFDTSTTMADPGTGDVRFNNATIASVTQVAVSASSASTGNPDVSDFVAAWDDSTSTTKGYIVIREAGAPGTTIVFAISGTITDNTTWLQIPVTHVSSAGTLSASDDLYFSFSRTGDAGLGSGDLIAANNLSDVADAATARSNLSAAASGANTDITSLTLADGSSSAPALANTGDTNTGIFFPTADTVGVAVGGTEVWRYGSNPTTAKNLIRNGAMTVAQRGSVNAGAGSGGSAYTQCDRWYYHERGGTEGAAVTLTQDTDVPAGQGFAYSLKCDVTTAEAAVAAGEMQGLQTRLEAQDLQHLIYGNAAAKTVALSFWMKSPKSGTHCVGLYQPDGTRSYVREFTVASADTWELHTVTFPGDASGTINNDAGEGLRLTFALTAGSTYQVSADAWAAGEDYGTSNQQNLLDNTANNIYITGVQLEVGSVATDFEHEDIGTTLAKCQRYLISVGENAYGPALAYGHAAVRGGETIFDVTVQHPVYMRAAPTFSGDLDWPQGVFRGTGYNGTGGSISAFTGMTKFNVTGASGMTAGDGGYYVYRGGKSGFLSAEL